MRLSPAWYQFLVGVFASLGSFLYGYDLGVIAEVLVCQSFTSKFRANDTETGLVVSLFTAGAFFGAGFAGPSGDYLGRRKTISVGCFVFTLGGGLQTGAKTIAYLYSGRLLAGFGVGFLTMMIPLYQAEICHPSIRGRVTALQQFMLGIGALCATWIGYGTYTGFAPTNSAQWQLPLGLQIAPAVFLGLLISFFPESPRWLIDHGRPEDGLRTLAKLHSHGDENDAWVQAEFAQIQESISFEHENEAKSYLDLFTHRASFRRLFLCCALQASGQMTGVSAIQYYSPQIYGQIGISDQDTLKYQAINSIIALIAQFLCMMYIDRFGRRWTLICGNLGNCVTFIIATVLLAQFPPETNNNGAHWGFIIMTWLYNFSFSATCGPLSWIIPAEVFDTRTRAKGVSIATMTSFAFNTMIGQVTPIAMTNIGYRFYILFVVCNFTNAIFFWLLLPETKRVPLEEMNQMFTNAPWIVPGSKKRRLYYS
ncbi:Major facilitator superfamily domain general substrate transporter [Penicillium vulpinum]|uniref:Major facilitator superfamily domain general substrate transporter n=1 Tax=Penicillium vulpinum TaxID=29845 RepID=UPI002546DB4F|nr:Major facilitator superfamily domain general substrate transporter [Penicillium vulpinum]KAJ5951168.1 Major facilitator superfamily domain general substrate transporter [Penicillium vulpinum]